MLLVNNMVDKINTFQVRFIQRPPESTHELHIHLQNIVEIDPPDPEFDSIEEIDEYSGDFLQNSAPKTANKSVRPSSAKVAAMRPRYFKETSPSNKDLMQNPYR